MGSSGLTADVRELALVKASRPIKTRKPSISRTTCRGEYWQGGLTPFPARSATVVPMRSRWRPTTWCCSRAMISPRPIFARHCPARGMDEGSIRRRRSTPHLKRNRAECGGGRRRPSRYYALRPFTLLLFIVFVVIIATARVCGFAIIVALFAMSFAAFTHPLQPHSQTVYAVTSKTLTGLTGSLLVTISSWDSGHFSVAL